MYPRLRFFVPDGNGDAKLRSNGLQSVPFVSRERRFHPRPSFFIAYNAGPPCRCQRVKCILRLMGQCERHFDTLGEQPPGDYSTQLFDMRALFR